MPGVHVPLVVGSSWEWGRRSIWRSIFASGLRSLHPSPQAGHSSKANLVDLGDKATRVSWLGFVHGVGFAGPENAAAFLVAESGRLGVEAPRPSKQDVFGR